MKVILEIDDRYADVLSITAVGTSTVTTWVTTHAVALKTHNHLVLDADGKWTGMRSEDGKT